MQIHNIKLNSQVNVLNINLAIGNFDGVHLGHQKIIDDLIKCSRINSCPSAILSFKPHPRQFFSDLYLNFQIISEETKIYLLSKQGIDHYFSLEFNENIASLSPNTIDEPELTLTEPNEPDVAVKVSPLKTFAR